MRKIHKSLYWILSISSIISFAALLVLVICMQVFKNNSILLGVYSAWISIVSGLLFSSLISLIVQIVIDIANGRELLNRKELIRNREINILSREMSLFLSCYHDNESYLQQKYKIKDSLVNNNLDSNIVCDNMKVLNKVYKKAKQENKVFIENYLLISDYIRDQYNKIVDLINKKRIEFENINIDMNFQIFSKDELDVLDLIPLYVKNYNDNFYINIEKFVKIVDAFNLKINFDDNKWWSLVAVLLCAELDLKNDNI